MIIILFQIKHAIDSIHFDQDQFQKDHHRTIEEEYHKALRVDGEWVNLKIVDTGIDEENDSGFRLLEQSWLHEGEVFLIVYGIDSRRQFDKVKHFAKKVEKEKDFNLNESEKQKPLIIVGNKWYKHHKYSHLLCF